VGSKSRAVRQREQKPFQFAYSISSAESSTNKRLGYAKLAYAYGMGSGYESVMPTLTVLDVRSLPAVHR
jgi:hypothetical protein